METVNYSQYRMTNYDWIGSYLSYMGKTSFDSFLNRVYARLMKMNVGERFNLTTKVKEQNRDLFIKCACLFITEGNGHYSFSEDYTKIYMSNK